MAALGIPGDVAAAMQKFMHGTFAGILNPITEHVEELQARVAQLLKDVDGLQNRAGATDERLGTHHAVLRDLGSDLGGTKADLRDHKEELLAAAFEKRISHLEARGHWAAAAIEKLENRADGAEAYSQRLQGSLENIEADLHRLQLKVWQTNNLMQQVESRVSEMRDEQVTGADRFQALSRAVQTGHRTLEANRLAVGKVSTGLDALQAETEKAQSALKDRASNLERGLSELTALARAQDQRNVQTDATIQEIAGALSKVRANITEYDGGSTEASKHRIGTLEASFAELRRLFYIESEKNLQGMIRELTATVRGQAAELFDATDALRRLTQEHGATAQTLAHTQLAVKEQEGRHDSLLDRVVAVEADVNTIMPLQKEFEGRLEAHRLELERVRATQLRTSKGLEETNASVKVLNGDLGNACEGVAKIATRIDLAHEVLHGMNRGFQETHRSVSNGQDGLLAPRIARGKALPVLSMPKPRPVSALLRGRCVPKDGEFAAVFNA